MVDTNPPSDNSAESKVREKTCWQCGETFRTEMEVCPNDGARLIEVVPEEESDPLIGSIFDGRFRVYGKLGEGGMGTVYAARRLDFDSDVAIKLLKGDFIRDEGIRRRFLYEARTISNLKHPHAVRLYDFGQTAEGLYMVMELLKGESLADRLAYRFVTYREIFDIIPPICGVLGEAHDLDVIHRDLKPENIFLLKVDDKQEFPKLLDFGIAKHIRAETMTQSGTLWGTPAYMSPEQARGDTVGARADIYAIGIILFELISGNLPFHATTQMGFAVKHINEPARPLASIPGLTSVPPELDDYILRLLSKAPEDRPEDMEVVARDLTEIKERCFDDALLDRVPAEEVDPIQLQAWVKAPDVSQSMAAVSDSSQEFGAHAAPPADPAQPSTPTRRAERDTDATVASPRLDDIGEFDTIAMPQPAKAAPSELQVPSEVSDVEVDDSAAEIAAQEATASDVSGTTAAAATAKPIWQHPAAIGAAAAAAALIAGLAVWLIDDAPPAPPEPAAQLEQPPPPSEPIDMSNVVGVAALHAAHIIVEARNLTREMEPESQLIFGEDLEILDRDGKPQKPADERPANPAAPRAPDDSAIKKALENTF